MRPTLNSLITSIVIASCGGNTGELIADAGERHVEPDPRCNEENCKALDDCQRRLLTAPDEFACIFKIRDRDPEAPLGEPEAREAVRLTYCVAACERQQSGQLLQCFAGYAQMCRDDRRHGPAVAEARCKSGGDSGGEAAPEVVRCLGSCDDSLNDCHTGCPDSTMDVCMPCAEQCSIAFDACRKACS